MRTVVLACAAIATVAAADATFAADMRVKGPVLKAPPPPVVYDWTGFYVGGHAGYAWTHKEWNLPTGGEIADYTADGWIYGGQIGFNWQTGSSVVGVEAQASFGKVRKGVSWVDTDPNPWV